MGGWSAEREISLVSGNGVADALEKAGHTVTRVDVRRDLPALLQALTPRPDVIFNALHGRGGEDGTVQGVLDFLSVPYTHSGVLASAVAMDKAMTKQIVERLGVRSPRGQLVRPEDLASAPPVEPPYVIKPNNEGSSFGVRIVRKGDNLPPPGQSWSWGDRVLVEEYIPGRELTVAVVGDRALTVTEIRPASGFFDHAAKYTAGGAAHHTPAAIPEEIAQEAKRFAFLAHTALGCRGASRSDLRWDDSRPGTSGLYFLEINTQPGMTPLSLVPEQAQYTGMSYGDLVSWMVENAACSA